MVAISYDRSGLVPFGFGPNAKRRLQFFYYARLVIFTWALFSQVCPYQQTVSFAAHIEQDSGIFPLSGNLSLKVADGLAAHPKENAGASTQVNVPCAQVGTVPSDDAVDCSPLICCLAWLL